MKRLIAAVAALAFVGFASASAYAQSTLDEVIKRGTLVIGVSLGTPPFGITNATMEPDGFDVDMGKLIARDLGVKAQFVDIVAAARIPSLTTNKVDIVVSSFSITAERAKAINYSNAIYVDQQVALAPKALSLASLDDFKGKRLGVTRSTTNDIVATKKAVEGTNIQRYDDDASTNQAMLAGQIDGMVTSAATAAAIIGRDPKLEIKFVVAEAAMGIGLRRGDADLLRWLNTEIYLLWANKEIQALQQKWMKTVNKELPRF
ncbi:MAG: transporter substrate-binding domain-containing protein [Proteobacteria bacterium]|nr:transporter substrate-binding domain-containing protein [Pseudomonadota bacterium]MBI3499907.1 transporter substrate-binding domain-containing protein [Pseudomonadota bacterium]